MSRIEYIAGHQWARETCEKAGSMLGSGQGVLDVIPFLQRGLVQKPADYAKAVSEVIVMVQDAADLILIGRKGNE